MTLTITTDRSTLTAASRERYLVIRMTAPDDIDRQIPLHVAVALDQSGSMGGNKHLQAIQALIAAASRLRPIDRLTITTFEEDAQQIADEHGGPELPDTLRQVLDQCQPGGGTHLSAGWKLAAKSIALPPDDTDQRKGLLLLITDGMPNSGETSIEDLSRRAKGYRTCGLPTAAFGIGTDYNETLLGTISDAGGSTYAACLEPGDIAKACDRIFAQLFAISLRQPSLALTLPTGVSAEVLGGRPHSDTDDGITIPLADMRAGETVELAVHLTFPTDMTDDPLVSVIASGATDGPPWQAADCLRWQSSNQDEAPDEAVLRLVAMLTLEEARLEALNNLDHLNSEQLTTYMNRTRSRLNDLGDIGRHTSRRLDDDLTSYSQGLSAEDRKTLHQSSWSITRSSSLDFDEIEDDDGETTSNGDEHDPSTNQ